MIFTRNSANSWPERSRAGQSPEQITFFKSVGNAVQDIAVGRRAVDRAMAQGMGQTINLA